MAGVWSPWKNPKTGEWERTFAIVTTAPNKVMLPVKDRQPLILEPREYGEYLAETERPPVHLFRVLPAEDLRRVWLNEWKRPLASRVCLIVSDGCRILSHLGFEPAAREPSDAADL